MCFVTSDRCILRMRPMVSKQSFTIQGIVRYNIQEKNQDTSLTLDWTSLLCTFRVNPFKREVEFNNNKKYAKEKRKKNH
jgi:hypothetical protein